MPINEMKQKKTCEVIRPNYPHTYPGFLPLNRVANIYPFALNAFTWAPQVAPPNEIKLLQGDFKGQQSKGQGRKGTRISAKLTF